MDQAAVGSRSTFDFAHVNVDAVLRKNSRRDLSNHHGLQIDGLREAIWINAAGSAAIAQNALESEAAKEEGEGLSGALA
ncbi:MAG: hypothetical protein HETSPECPRED_000205 [Heterodermia speciosa]|uniref:Uncharacterized protein n=1 Tax=Heterodermia speciosa TaxID=116794 RepID=A0A8H3EHX0_9LECA|nr:MAG: hypothetical protein HETSPECPRED_000205 [Heterodermia speciosa]